MNFYYPFVNTPLPYEYDALKPYIDEKTMRLHHDRHLAAYIDNLNAVLKDAPALQRLSLTQLLQNPRRIPAPIRETVCRNAGGVYNHRFFFDGMRPPEEGGTPSGALAASIERRFGSIETFEKNFTTAALSVFGSGYAWLVFERGRLQIITTPNQISPVSCGMTPLLAVDVWEHAYYLKHYNERGAYLADFLKVVDWEQVQRRFSCMYRYKG